MLGCLHVRLCLSSFEPRRNFPPGMHDIPSIGAMHGAMGVPLGSVVIDVSVLGRSVSPIVGLGNGGVVSCAQEMPAKQSVDVMMSPINVRVMNTSP